MFGVNGGSTSSYPLCIPHPRARARHRGPSPATRNVNGVEHDECLLVHLRPRRYSQRRVKRGHSRQQDTVATGMQHREPNARWPNARFDHPMNRHEEDVVAAPAGIQRTQTSQSQLTCFTYTSTKQSTPHVVRIEISQNMRQAKPNRVPLRTVTRRLSRQQPNFVEKRRVTIATTCCTAQHGAPEGHCTH